MSSSEEAWKEWTDALLRYEALHLKLSLIPISHQILAELLMTVLGSLLVLMLSGLPKTWTMH